MPAKSEKQRNLMLAAKSCKETGKCKFPLAKKIAKSMTSKQLNHFTKMEVLELKFKNFLKDQTSSKKIGVDSPTYAPTILNSNHS